MDPRNTAHQKHEAHPGHFPGKKKDTFVTFVTETKHPMKVF